MLKKDGALEWNGNQANQVGQSTREEPLAWQTDYALIYARKEPLETETS